MSSGGARVSIPSSVRKMIQNIKEIMGNHGEEEIYAMLKECCMDPNETAQKLLHQDTFHEVKRKRDRRKENLSKEPAESRWKPGMQERGNRAGRANYAPRHISHDVGGVKNSYSGKENGNLVLDKGAGQPPLSTSQDNKHKEVASISSSLTGQANGPTGMPSLVSNVKNIAESSIERAVNQPEAHVDDDISTLERSPTLTGDANKSISSAFSAEGEHGQMMPKSTSCMPSSMASGPSTEVYLSASDPVLLPSQGARIPGTVGTIKREGGSQRTLVEQVVATSSDTNVHTASEPGGSFVQGNMPIKSQIRKNQFSESSQLPSSTIGGPASRPLSNYSGQSQVTGPYKVGPSMEWKPKSAISNLSQGSGSAVLSEVLESSVETSDQSESGVAVPDTKEAISELAKKSEDLTIQDVQHVIIPNHLHVPDAGKLGFCFGSFDANFGINTSYNIGNAGEKSPPPPSETSEETEETGEEQSSSNQNAIEAIESGDYNDHPQPSAYVPDDVASGEANVSSTLVSEYTESKQETALPPGGHQPAMVHTSPNFSFGFMPPILGSQLPQFESSEPQARDASRLPGFVVQQPFDPTSYCAQFYRSGADSDGRISPFHLPGVATKYNGNVAVLPSQTSQSPQEVGNPLVLSSGVPTPLVTQAAGIIPSSISVTQQQLPVFRQPPGMHLPHYAPNYIPYGHYFPPFIVQPPAIHQFLSNSAFPQQPLAGNVYPAAPATTAKYSLSQYKPGTNAGNSSQMGVGGNYGSFGSSAAGYNPSSAATPGNSTSNEDMAASQFKETNAYITGQQSEGSGVWIAASGRDISGLQASSFYNLPQGQVAFTPTQAGHGAFAYHPAPPVTGSTVHPLLQQSQTMGGAVDIVGPTAGVYQQPQPAQINWPNNY